MEPSFTYYIHNYSVQPELLFRTDENYRFFVQKVQQHISPVAQIRAYCLLPDQFHFLVEIRAPTVVRELQKQLIHPSRKQRSLSYFVSRKFSDCFNSYAQAYNKMYSRDGALFQKNFKRLETGSDMDAALVVDMISQLPEDNELALSNNNWKWIFLES